MSAYLRAPYAPKYAHAYAHVLAGARASQAYTAAQLCCDKVLQITCCTPTTEVQILTAEEVLDQGQALRAAASATRAAYISERMGVAASAEDLAAIDAAAARLAPDFECRHVC
jgi:hypothetical protein